MRLSGWAIKGYCWLLLGVAQLGLVFSTTLKDLASVRRNFTFKQLHRSDHISLLSTLNQSLAHEHVFLGAGLLTNPTMGNLLSTYFEKLACCNILGVHFVYRANISTDDEKANKFFGTFPQIHVHPHPSNKSGEELSKQWNETCPYATHFPFMHKGAWNQRPHMIAQIMHNAVRAVFPAVLNETIPVTSFAHIMPEKMPVKELPLVPSAAIVFRCVDILFFNSDSPSYGFLSFNAYKELIPQNATTIYVLSEELSYIIARPHTVPICIELGKNLIQFLHREFPRAIVAMRRGHAIDSVAMLSNAATVVSAPSSFTVFPGVANPNRVYLMASGNRPVFFDQPFMHSNFMWLHSPAVIMGGDATWYEVNRVLEALTRPLSEPVGYATHLPEVDYCAKFTPTLEECIKGL